MKTITKEQLEQMREEIAKSQGLERGKDARYYHCKKKKYKRNKAEDNIGKSKSTRDKVTGKTASYQWCKHFEYVGNSE